MGGGEHRALSCRECPLAKAGATGRGEVVWCTAQDAWVAPESAKNCEVEMSSGTAWTEDELIMLNSFYPEYGGNWRGWDKALPGRSRASITVMACKQGIKHEGVTAYVVEQSIAMPCPFCGSMPFVGEVTHRGRKWWRVACNDAACGADVAAWGNTKERALKNWNRRA